MWTIKEYSWRRQDTIDGYLEKCMIYELCTGLDRIQGSNRILRWREEDNIHDEAGK